jgi:hypothetical protein
VPADEAGLAAALLNASQQVGGALGLAIFSAIATSRTTALLATHTPIDEALTSGFHRALLASSIFLVAAALLGLRTANTRGEERQLGPASQPTESDAGGEGDREHEVLPEAAAA